MGRRKWVLTAITIFLLAFLVALAGEWSPTSAYLIVSPESDPSGGETAGLASAPGDQPGRFPRVECLSAPLGPTTHLDQHFMLYPYSDSQLVWGGVENAPGVSCQDATEMVCAIPERFLPMHEQLNFYRPGIEVLQFIQGSQDDSDSCGSKDVYFDLTRYERSMYANHADQFGFYHINFDGQAWELCPRVRLDENAGEYGRIICSTTRWGYYVLGWPATE